MTNSLFRNRVFRAGLLLTVVAGLTAGNTLFVSLYLQRVEGLSTLQAALWLLPGTLAMLLVIQVSPLLTRHLRAPRVIGGGLAGGLNVSSAICAGVVLLAAALVVRLRT